MTTGTRTALQDLLVEEIDDLPSYARRALRALRSPASRSEWKGVYERGVSEAFRRHDMAGLAAIVSVAMARLDAEGAGDEAVAYRDFAMAMADGLPDALVLLQSMRAAYEALQGNVAQADGALRAARRQLRKTSSDLARLEYEWSSAVVASMSLQVRALPRIRRSIAHLEQNGMDAQASLVMRWFIPMLVALGQRDAAAPWIESLRIYAQTAQHPWRLADAGSFAYALDPTAGARPELASAAELASSSGNWEASWRLGTLQLRTALVRGDWGESDALVEELSGLATRMSPGYADALSAFAGLVASYRGEEEALHLLRPPRLSLVNVAAILAAAEAVAIAGTQHDAAEWLERTVDLLPRHVLTALEWPVARDRVFGLLLLRSRKVPEAVASLRRGIDWASAAGYEVEAAVGQVQLAEVLALGVSRSRERQWSRLQRAGWLKLREFDIDPTLHAYVATRALARGRAGASRPELTPRQAQVLKLLADGLTYRQAAERLGTSWRTVSTQAYQAYERLGVHSKLQAIRAAERLQIL